MRISPYRRAFLRTVVTVMFISLVACAGSVPTKKYVAQPTNETKSIAILGMPDPEVVVVLNRGGWEMAFGLIGGFISAAKTDKNTKKLTDALIRLGYNPRKELRAELESALSSTGYNVSHASDIRTIVTKGAERDYSAIEVNADLILDVWHTAIIFISPAYSSEYRPLIAVAARLVSQEKKEEEYFQIVSYGFDREIEGVTNLDAPASDSFSDVDEMFNNPGQVHEVIRRAQRAIAKRISLDLKT